MLQDIVDSRNINDTMKAMEKRIKRNKKWTTIKPTKVEIIMEKLNNNLDEWTREKVTETLNNFSNQYFKEQVITPEVHEDPKA